MANMAHPLTDRQRRILDFIADFTARQHYPPSFEEIRQALGLSTKSLVDYHLNVLERKGYVTMERGKTRTIRINTINTFNSTGENNVTQER